MPFLLSSRVRLALLALFMLLPPRASAVDSEFCQLAMAAKGDPRAEKRLIQIVGRSSATLDGLRYLLEHLEPILEAGVLRESWLPLARIPESLPQMIQYGDRRPFEILSLLWQFRLARTTVEPGGEPTPQALAAQEFLRAVQREIRHNRATLLDGPASLQVKALSELMERQSLGWEQADPYQPPPTTSPVDREMLRRASQLITRELEGYRELYDDMESFLDAPVLGLEWRNIFEVRPARSYHFLAQANDAAHYEVISIIRLIKLAVQGSGPEIRRYATDWVHTFFSLGRGFSAYSAQAELYIKALQELFGEKRGRRMAPPPNQVIQELRSMGEKITEHATRVVPLSLLLSIVSDRDLYRGDPAAMRNLVAFMLGVAPEYVSDDEIDNMQEPVADSILDQYPALETFDFEFVRDWRHARDPNLLQIDERDVPLSGEEIVLLVREQEFRLGTTELLMIWLPDDLRRGDEPGENTPGPFY